MHADHRVLFHIRACGSGGTHSVERWGRYGVVLPTLLTTNGSAVYLAAWLGRHISAGLYEIVEPEWASLSPGELLAKLHEDHV